MARQAKFNIALEEIAYTDDIGRNFVVLVAPGQAPELGLIKGPPLEVYDTLIQEGMSTSTALALHNELHARGLITEKDVARRIMEVFAAWQAASGTNVQRIVSLYTPPVQEEEVTNSRSQRSNLIPRVKARKGGI